MKTKNISNKKDKLKGQDADNKTEIDIKEKLETIKNNNKNKLQKNKITLIVFTILSSILVLISFFWIPVLSVFGVNLSYSPLVVLSPLIVAICAIPLAVCIVLLIKRLK